MGSSESSKAHYAKYHETYLARFKKAREELRIYIDKVKSVPCMDCGGTFNPWQMDFDHVKGTKLFNVAHARRLSQRVLDEIDKCDIVCANCHRNRTFKSPEAPNMLGREVATPTGKRPRDDAGRLD